MEQDQWLVLSGLCSGGGCSGAEAVVALGGYFDEKTLQLSEPRVKPFAPNVGFIKPNYEGRLPEPS